MKPLNTGGKKPLTARRIANNLRAMAVDHGWRAEEVEDWIKYLNEEITRLESTLASTQAHLRSWKDACAEATDVARTAQRTVTALTAQMNKSKAKKTEDQWEGRRWLES